MLLATTTQTPMQYRCLSKFTRFKQKPHHRVPRYHVSCGVRAHAQLPAVDLKSTPLTTRAN